MKVTFIYISIIIILIFKDNIIQSIIDFNLKHNVAHIIQSNNISNILKNFNLNKIINLNHINLNHINLNHINLNHINLNNINLNHINLNHINFKNITNTHMKICLLMSLFIYLFNKKSILNITILIVCFIFILLFYNKINFILNQCMNIYNNSFLINKFILV